MYSTIQTFGVNEIFFNVSKSLNKAEFSASLLQSSVSPDPSEIILICGFAA